MEALVGTEFASIAAAEAAVHEAAKAQSVSLAIFSKKPSAANCRRIIWRCSKGKPYRASSVNEDTHKDKKRKTSTKSTDCKFRIAAKLQIDENTTNWVIEWVDVEGSQQHNHEIDLPLAAHSKYRHQALQAFEADIIEMIESGITPSNVLSKLRCSDNPEAMNIARKDIVNLIAKHRQQQLAGRTPVEWLYNQLKSESDFFFRDQIHHSTGRLTCLFIAPKSGINLLRDNPDILLMDSTYKTNRFKMPLLSICGTTLVKKSFQVAAVFLTREKEDDYTWAIRQLSQLLESEGIRPPRCITTDRELALMNSLNGHMMFRSVPHILCHWHINTNILSNAKKHFPKPTRGSDGVIQRDPKFDEFLDEWNALIRSHTPEIYASKLTKFEEAGRYPVEAVQYAVKTWLEPWKTKIVRCYIDQHPHFGTLTTSIVESSHASLKKFLLHRSTGDLKTVFERLRHYWLHQDVEAAVEAAQQRNKVLIATHFLLQKVRFQISPLATTLVGEQLRKLPRQRRLPAGPCTCTITTTHGIPCQHVLDGLIRDSQPLELTHIDAH
jgi:MULE transposase domain